MGRRHNKHARTQNPSPRLTSRESPPNPQQTDKGARLRIAFEHAALERLISQIHNDDEDFDRLCKALHAYCELRKQDAALEKNKLGQTKAATPNTRTASTPRTAATNLAVPFGLDDRGDPNARTQFQASLRQTISDLYGTATQPHPPEAAPHKADDGIGDPPTKRDSPSLTPTRRF